MKNTKIRKPLSILLSILMIVMTCSVAFGVNAEDETTLTAVEQYAEYIDTDEVQSVVLDMIGNSAATTDVITIV